MNVAINFADPSQIQRAIKKYGETKYPIFAVNEKGESQIMSISSDCITIETLQKNHHIRKNVFWQDGTVEEMYCGTWEE